MSVTRSAVFVGIMCSMWIASPLTVNAFELGEFVGLSDRGLTRVKSCVEGKGGRSFFSNKTALGVELNIDLSGGDGLAGDDLFDASVQIKVVDKHLDRVFFICLKYRV